jgi:hypothetical protein
MIANGKLLCGTETMFLTPYKGKLYVGTSNWTETNSTLQACHLLVLDSPGASWRELHKFAAANTRFNSLITVTFTTDTSGFEAHLPAHRRSRADVAGDLSGIQSNRCCSPAGRAWMGASAWTIAHSR